MLTSGKILYVFAMEIEAADCFKDKDVLFTGVGKVNAAYHLTKRIAHDRPEMIVNLGSAGSTLYNVGQVVCCNRFLQRDMNVTCLGFQPYQTPFMDAPIILDNGITVDNLPLGICGTGDSFDISANKTGEYNVADMEAYALALVALQEKIPFICLKYITDGADGAAPDDWNVTVNHAAHALKKAIECLEK